jgi:hypothetical protein
MFVAYPGDTLLGGRLEAWMHSLQDQWLDSPLIGAWRNLVARGLWVAEVPGPNPGAPIGDG